MFKSREKDGKKIGILGWGIGWGISWMLIGMYQASVDIRSLGYSPEDGGFQSLSYLVWTLTTLIIFAIGWLIAGISTGGILRSSISNFQTKHFISITRLWGVSGLILGLLLSQFYAFGELVMPSAESLYYLYLGCLYPILILVGYGLTGYWGSLEMGRVLDKNISIFDNPYIKKGIRIIAFGLVLGVFTGLVTMYVCFTVLYEMFDVYFPPPTPAHFILAGLGGFVGGVIAGSFIYRVIGKYLLEYLLQHNYD